MSLVDFHFYEGFNSGFFFSFCEPIIMSLHACNLIITRLRIQCCCLYQTTSEKHNKATSASYSSNLHTMIATMMTIMSSCQRHPYIPVKTTPCAVHLFCHASLALHYAIATCTYVYQPSRNDVRHSIVSTYSSTNSTIPCPIGGNVG